MEKNHKKAFPKQVESFQVRKGKSFLVFFCRSGYEGKQKGQADPNTLNDLLREELKKMSAPLPTPRLFLDIGSNTLHPAYSQVKSRSPLCAGKF